MLPSLVSRNFTSCCEAVMPLASMTSFTGPGDSGRSNALEALRLLSWLARGIRQEDIKTRIQSGDAHIRCRAADLFKRAEEPLTIGCRTVRLADMRRFSELMEQGSPGWPADGGRMEELLNAGASSRATAPAWAVMRNSLSGTGVSFRTRAQVPPPLPG